jgi:hypothetical protein
MLTHAQDHKYNIGVHCTPINYMHHIESIISNTCTILVIISTILVESRINMGDYMHHRINIDDHKYNIGRINLSPCTLINNFPPILYLSIMITNIVQ